MSLLGAAAITAGGALAGGLLGSSSANKAANKDYRRQKEFAQNTVRWKVEDAKRAGLHPLFALGGNTASFSPSYTAGNYGTGEAVRDAAGAIAQGYASTKAPPPGTPEAMSMKVAGSQAERNEAEADYFRSMAAREVQALNHTQDTPLFTGDSAPGQVRTEPAKSVSRSPGDRARTASKQPMYKRWQYGPRSDEWIDIPYSDEGPLEEFGPGKAFGTIMRWLQNRAKSAPLPKRRKRRGGSNAARRRSTRGRFR